MAYSLVMNSSRLSSTRLNSTQAAASACGTPSSRLREQRRRRSSGPCQRDCSCLVEILAQALGLRRADGSRAERQLDRRSSDGRGSPPAISRRMRNASPCAASKKTGSFSRFSACSGVFGALAARAGQVRVRRVEVHQLRIRHGALEVDVQAAAVPVRPRALLPLHRCSRTTARRPLRAAAASRSGRRSADRAGRRRTAPRRESAPPAGAGATGARAACSPDPSPSVPAARSTTAGRWPRSPSAGPSASCSSRAA